MEKIVTSDGSSIFSITGEEIASWDVPADLKVRVVCRINPLIDKRLKY